MLKGCLWHPHFRIVQDSLWEDLLLHLARLTDPPKSVGRTNLSIRNFAELLKDSPIADQIATLVEQAVAECEFCRDWRNRHLAHRDLELALGQSVQPLAPASRASVKSALMALASALNAVSIHFRSSTTVFERGPDGDATSLLYLLRDGLRYREELIDRIKRGECPPSALKPEPI
jgi:AbiU2